MDKVKLYDVPRESRIFVTGLTVNNILHEEINFHNIDGAFSFCTLDDGTIVHLPATTEVYIINKKE